MYGKQARASNRQTRDSSEQTIALSTAAQAQLRRFDAFADYANLAAIESWLASLDTRSDKTRAAYADGVLTLLGYAKTRGLVFEGLEADDIMSFRSNLVESGRRPSTVSIYLAGVRSYYRHCAAAGYGADIAAGAKGAKQPRGFKKEILSPADVWEILERIDRETLQGMRDYALINLMVRCGLRDVEVARALVGDIGFPSEQTAVLTVWGKGRAEKDDFVVLEEAALSPIADYLARRGRPADDEPLFASLSPRNPGAALTTRSVSRIVKNRMRAVGIDSERFTAHSLRHTAVTYALMGGATVQEAQAMARHADISTTMVYAHNVERLKHPGESAASSFLDSAKRG